MTFAKGASALERLGFESRFADVKAARMRYFVGGEGDPLLLIHGFGGAAPNWAPLAPTLARRHRLLVPDLPGHGGSSPLPAVPNLDAFADRVAIVAERESMLPAAVVGHSLGALVALRMALRRPGDVQAVVLAGAAGISSTTRRAKVTVTITALLRPGRVAARYQDVVARVPWLRSAVFGYWGASDPAALEPEAVHGFLEAARLHSDVVSAGAALVLDDPRRDLELVRCPCLVLWGARDHQTPLDDAFAYARRLRADLRVVADCGHLLIGERPDACIDAVESFLARVRAPTLSA